MMRRWVLVSFMCLLGTAANAKWESQTLEDPMTDEKAAWIGTDSDDSSLSILFKCWDDADKTKWLAILTGKTYDEAASYEKIQTLKLRIDKNKVQEVPFGIEQFDGKIAYVTIPAVGSAFENLQREMFATQSRVVIEIDNKTTQFNAGSIRPSLQKVLRACNIQAGS